MCDSLRSNVQDIELAYWSKVGHIWPNLGVKTIILCPNLVILDNFQPVRYWVLWYCNNVYIKFVFLLIVTCLKVAHIWAEIWQLHAQIWSFWTTFIIFWRRSKNVCTISLCLAQMYLLKLWVWRDLFSANEDPLCFQPYILLQV